MDIIQGLNLDTNLGLSNIEKETLGLFKKTKKKLMKEKKEIAKEYIEKKVNNPLLDISGIVKDYLITNSWADNIKDEFFNKTIIENSGIDKNILDEMKKLKESLANIDTQQGLENIRKQFLEGGINIEETNITNEQNIDKDNSKTADNPSQIISSTVESNNGSKTEKLLSAEGEEIKLTEKQQKYIDKITKKFGDPKKENIQKYGPIVIHEALKHDETKDIIEKIFAQINKESGRNPEALNNKGEYSVGLMQINKKAGHTGKLNGKDFDIDKPEGNIAYGIQFLANCIKEAKGNIRKGFNLYNGKGNLKKPESQQYAHSIINDKEFNEKLVA